MKLKPGEIECDKCKESRRLYDIQRKEKPWIGEYNIWCPKCHGWGKLDWVEAVVGKKAFFWEYQLPGGSNITPIEGQIFKDTENKTYIFTSKNGMKLVNYFFQ